MALMKCPDCGKEFSDSAKQCPNCGYKNKKTKNINSSLNFSLISGVVLAFIGLIISVFFTLASLFGYNGPMIHHTVSYFIQLIIILTLFIIGGVLISNKYKKAKKLSLIIGVLLLLINIICAPIKINSEKQRLAENETESYMVSEVVEVNDLTNSSNPNSLYNFIGTWGFNQPNNQDGLKSIKFIVNDDETVQAIVNKNGKEITVYGSFNYYDHLPNQINMHFNDTEEHINGILYIDHLRIFKGYNDYFGIKYGVIKGEKDGKVYLYEESDDADAKNPNKRVELTKID